MPEIEETTREKDEDRPGKPHKRVKSFPNKVVIRKLPPNLNTESFLEMVSPLPDYYDVYFCAADWTLGAEATSRAYIEFKHEEDIFIFKDKFDGYVFVDCVRGSEYPAIVEYAPFQGLPKSRARKKDKNLGTIENEQHFLNFLEQLKKDEEAENQKPEAKIEYSYQIKDDKKVTSTPLIEFLSAKKEEKRDAKKKKLDVKKRQRDDEKHKKKVLLAKNIPEAVKEVKEEVVYDDGVVVRTVPSRLGRNEKKKEPKAEKEMSEKDQERKEKRQEKKEAERRKYCKEKEEKRKAANRDRDLQKTKDQNLKKPSVDGEKATAPAKEPSKDAPAKTETKRYSALRKARQEKSGDAADTNEPQKLDEETQQKEETEKAEEPPKKEPRELTAAELAKKEARLRRNQELREKRAREADERAQRQIKNKDRPSMQIYQPKRRNDTDGRSDLKSSDENSEASRKKSDTERKFDKRERDRRYEKKSSRKNSRDETSRRKKPSRKNSDEGAGGDHLEAGNSKDTDEVADKLVKLILEEAKESSDSSKVATPSEHSKVEVVDDSPAALVVVED